MSFNTTQNDEIPGIPGASESDSATGLPSKQQHKTDMEMVARKHSLTEDKPVEPVPC
jgi:hypothetical protein